MALALSGSALDCGVESLMPCVVARLPLLELGKMRSLSLRLLALGSVLTSIGQTLALIRHVFTLVGGPLALIRDPLALVGDPVAVIGGLLAPIGHPLALVRDPRSHPRLSLLMTSLGPQPGALALQHLIIGLELHRPAPKLRADALDLRPRRLILLLQQADAQLPQVGPIGVELGEITLQGGEAPLKLRPLRIATRVPRGGCCFVARCTLLMDDRRPKVYSPVPGGADR